MTARATSPTPEIRAFGTVLNPWEVDGPHLGFGRLATVVLEGDWTERLKAQRNLRVKEQLCVATRVWVGTIDLAPASMLQHAALPYPDLAAECGDGTVTVLEYRQAP